MSAPASALPTHPDVSAAEVSKLARLKRDTPFFCENVLRIRDKQGRELPLKMNRAQLFTHQALEEQKRRTGRVRAIVVKGRKVGISTYIQARFYHRLSTTGEPLSAFILTHEQAATETLFGMSKFFYERHEIAYGRPLEERANAKQLKFADSQASITVATAGSRETGRGGTFQIFHASEAAFWADPGKTMAGAIQTVGDLPGTEIIVESTANGVGGYFFTAAQAALRGQSEFILVFIPWMWDEDLQKECPDTWDPSPEWLEYAKLHGLTWEQLYWAFTKNQTMAHAISEPDDRPCWKFLQEYPATFDEAFQGGGNSFIPSISVMKARKPRETIIGAGPVILGVDPARSGDRIGIIDRCGRRAGERICEAWDPPGSSLIVAQRVADAIDRIRPDAVNIDVGSNGAAVYDLLRDWGYENLTPVNFGAQPIGMSPTGEYLYFNRRAELYDLARAWFEGDLPVQIEDLDDLHQDLCGATWGDGKTRYDAHNKLILEEKAAIKKRLGASPDMGDAFVLTFATPFARKATARRQPARSRRRSTRTGY